MNRKHYQALNWLSMYWNNDGERYRYLDWDKDEPDVNEVPRYEIVFDYGQVRFYCFVDARNIDEALGIFFRHHPTVTYEQIYDHVEI